MKFLNMTDEALAAVVEEANVFARVTPAQKDRIINALENKRACCRLHG